MKHGAYLILALCCAGCGGGSGSGVPLIEVPVTSEVFGFAVDSVAYSEETDTYTLFLEDGFGVDVGDEVVVAGAPVFDFRSFDVAEDGRGNAVFVAETENAQVTLNLLRSGATGVAFARSAAGAIPESGSAQFNGDYVALLQNFANEDILLIVNADAELDVDFGTGNVSGVISNRVARSTEGNAILASVGRDNLVLQNGALDETGTFIGEASGGNLDLSLLTVGGVTTTEAGSFGGIVAGGSGEDVVGAASIFHEDDAAGAFFEEGAFIAKQ